MKIFPISLLLGAFLITLFPFQTHPALPELAEKVMSNASTLLTNTKDIAQTICTAPETAMITKAVAPFALGLTSCASFLGFFVNMIDVNLGMGAYTWTGEQRHLDFANKALKRARICLALSVGSLAGAGYLMYRG